MRQIISGLVSWMSVPISDFLWQSLYQNYWNMLTRLCDKKILMIFVTCTAWYCLMMSSFQCCQLILVGFIRISGTYLSFDSFNMTEVCSSREFIMTLTDLSFLDSGSAPLSKRISLKHCLRWTSSFNSPKKLLDHLGSSYFLPLWLTLLLSGIRCIIKSSARDSFSRSVCLLI